MKKFLLTAALMLASLSSTVSLGQSWDRPKNWEFGDKLTFNWVLSGKPTQMIEEVVGVSDSEIGLRYTVGDRTYEAALSSNDMTYPRGICLSNGQTCQFSPAFKWVDFPLEKGKKWSGTTTVTGEAFISELTYERNVDKIERIKTPAGQFEAYRVSSSGRIKATDKNGGSPSRGKESATDWFALVNGKLVVVKTEYKNSYGERFTRELVSADVK